MADHRRWQTTAMPAAAMLVAAFLAQACGGPGDDVAEVASALEVNALYNGQAYRSLAFRWAPVHYQDVHKTAEDNGLGGRSDYVLRFDYDGDFIGRNNWDNLEKQATWVDMRSYFYYVVEETQTHWFIYYLPYHPRSWIIGTFDKDHENDGESCVMAVRKDGTTFGTLEAIATMIHSDWANYSVASYVGKGPKNTETPARLVMENVEGVMRPRTYQEPAGHGFIGCTASTACVKNDDGVRYVPGVVAEAVSTPIPDGRQVTVHYALLDGMQLFAHRYDWPTYATIDAMNGDKSGTCGDAFTVNCTENAALGVWVHGDKDMPFTGGRLPGEDPAAFFAGLFSFGGLPVSNQYLSRVFLHEKCATGRPMQGSTDACAPQVCTQDPYCCSTAWDSICVGEVASICGQSCSSCTYDTATTNTSVNICAAQAGPIGDGCASQCASQICAQDPYCCQTQWDGICVSEVASICALHC